MLFNSYTFWCFFVIVLVLNRLLPHKWQNRMLLVGSYVFYGAWDWRFLSLILISTIVDFFAAVRIAALDPQRTRGRGRVARRLWLSFSLVTNLGLLGFFKYLLTPRLSETGTVSLSQNA